MLPCLHFGMNRQCIDVVRLMWPAYDRKRENSSAWTDRIIVAFTCRRAVWLLRNLTLDGKLCLRDDKNAVFV